MQRTLALDVSAAFVEANFHGSLQTSPERPFTSYPFVIRSLSLVGISCGRRRSSVATISLLLLVVLFWHRTIFVILSFGRKHFWSAVVDFLRTLSSVHVTFELFSKRDLLTSCLWKSLPVLQSRAQSQRQFHGHRRVETIFAVLTVVLWLYVALRFFLDVWSHDMRLLATENFLRSDFGKSPFSLDDHLLANCLAGGASVLSVVHLALDRFIVTGATTFGLLLYALLCVTTVDHVRLYNRVFVELSKRNIALSSQQLRHWIENRVRLQQTVLDVETLLGRSVFLWYLCMDRE